MRFIAAAALVVIFSTWITLPVHADDEGRYQIVPIKRDIDSDKGPRTVNGTMMVDGASGRTWILDEERGRWVPVGFRAPKLGSDVKLVPDASK